MSIGPLGLIGSAAGSPLAQGQGSEAQRTQQETADAARQLRMNDKAEQAEGVGQAEQDEEASDRDADGRRLWENTLPSSDDSQSDQTPSDPHALPRSKDPTGQRGRQLDLNG